MSIGILIISHAQVGKILFNTACDILGHCPLPVFNLDIYPDDSLEYQQKQALAAFHLLDQGEGVLILTDLYGATPSNIADFILKHHPQVKLVSGLNLPMLLKTMNYAHEPLDKLAQKAMQGGQNGIKLLDKLASNG